MKKILLLLLMLPALDSVAQKWEKNYDFVDNCVCGLSKVKKDGKIGYVDKDGKVIITPQYDEGMTFNEGYSAVRKGQFWMFIDSTGKAITEAVYDDAAGFSEGLAPASKNGHYGYVNKAGEEAIAFSFSMARGFSEGLAPVSNNKGYWGYIDRQGTWIIKPVYDFTDKFENGTARVMKDQRMVYINRQNKIVEQ